MIRSIGKYHLFIFAYVAQNGLAGLGTITSILALLGGAAAFGFLAKLADADSPTGNIIAAYLIGVLVGAVLFVAADIAGYADGLFPGCDCASPRPKSQLTRRTKLRPAAGSDIPDPGILSWRSAGPTL
jgi:hypothetical protein